MEACNALNGFALWRKRTDSDNYRHRMAIRPVDTGQIARFGVGSLSLLSCWLWMRYASLGRCRTVINLGSERRPVPPILDRPLHFP